MFSLSFSFLPSFFLNFCFFFLLNSCFISLINHPTSNLVSEPVLLFSQTVKSILQREYAICHRSTARRLFSTSQRPPFNPNPTPVSYQRSIRPNPSGISKKIDRKHGGARSINQYASIPALISSKQCLNSKIATLIKP
jgi:hypothetical protein